MGPEYYYYKKQRVRKDPFSFSPPAGVARHLQLLRTEPVDNLLEFRFPQPSVSSVHATQCFRTHSDAPTFP